MSSESELNSIVERLFTQTPARYLLDNGLTLITQQTDSSDLMSAQVWVKTGSMHEGEHLGSGISHFVEHMLFKGTVNRTYKKISEDIQNVGADINAYTTFDRTVYYVDGPADALGTALDVLSDIVFNSSFNEQEVEREKNVILREIDMSLDDPDSQLSQAFFKTAYRDHPYQFPVLGERSLFTETTRNDLFNYYRSRYVPSNMVLVLASPLPHEESLAQAIHYFGKQKNKTLSPVFIPQEKPQMAPRKHPIFGDVQITRGLLAYKIPGLGDTDTPALSILANLLGSGHSAHLWQKLREEKKLVHNIDASIWTPGKEGLFFISYTCDPDKQEAVQKAIREELQTILKKGFSSEQVNKAIRQAMVSEVNGRKTVTRQASRLGVAEVIIGDLAYSRIHLNLLKAVTHTQLTEIQTKYIKDTICIEASLAPKQELQTSTVVLSTKKGLTDFEEVIFANGARLLLQPVSSLPKIAICATLLGGPLYETPETAGITGILATLLTKDTEQQTTLQIAETIENIGGSFSEFVGNNSFGLTAEVMYFDLATASSLLKNALTMPKFTEENFVCERDAQIAALQESNDEIADLAIRKLRQKFFSPNLYQFDPLGTMESLQALRLQDVIQQHKKLLHPKNLIISVSGDCKKEQILDTLGPWMSALTGYADFKKEHPSFEAPSAPGESEEFLDKEQVVVLQAYPGQGATDPRLEISEVLNELLSGMSSPLFVKVREEQGLAYYVGTSLIIGIGAGMFYFYAGTNTESYKQVIDAMNEEIKRLQTGNISNEEVDRCKRRLKAGHLMSLQTPSSRAMKSSLNALYNLPENHWKTYPERIDAVTKSDLQAFAQKHLNTQLKVQYCLGAIR